MKYLAIGGPLSGKWIATDTHVVHYALGPEEDPGAAARPPWDIAVTYTVRKLYGDVSGVRHTRRCLVLDGVRLEAALVMLRDILFERFLLAGPDDDTIGDHPG